MASIAGDSRSSRSKTRQQNVSLFPLEYAALRLIASEERNGNISAAVARMIDMTMTVRYGNNWRNQAPLGRAARDDIKVVA